MRVIDLLNKIANGEEVPKKIKFRDEIFEFQDGMYMTETNDYFEEYSDYTMLNMEVEIIEEDKKIKKLNMDLFDKNDVSYTFGNKINEIIDYLEENK